MKVFAENRQSNKNSCSVISKISKRFKTFDRSNSVSVFDQFLFLAYLISDNTRYLDRKSLFLAKLELSLFKSMTIVISKEGTS